MRRGRILPLVGPAVALYLLVEAGAGTLDLAGVILAGLAIGLALVPAFVGARAPEADQRSLAGLAIAASAVAVRLAAPELLSLPLAIATALALPWLGVLPLRLALDRPDAPAGIPWPQTLRRAVWVVGVVASVIGVLDAVGPLPGVEAVMLPSAWRFTGLVVATASLAVAAGLRTFRRRLGSDPEALGANAWAEMGVLSALGLLVLMGLVRLLAPVPAKPLVAAVATLGFVALVGGHALMLSARRQPWAARNARAVFSAGLAVAAAGLAIFLVADRLPSTPWGVAVAMAFTVAASALAYRALERFGSRWLAPHGGRLLRALDEAADAARRVSSLEGLAETVLPPFRRASQVFESDPLLYTLDPDREARVDAAGVPHIREATLGDALLTTLRDAPGDPVLRGPLEATRVRRPDLRPLLESLETRDTLVAVPLAVDGHLEGVLLLPRGRRRAALTLEELDGIGRLAQQLGSLIGLLNANERGRLRTREVVLEREDLEERIETLEEDLAHAHSRARLLGPGADRPASAVPAIAYSKAMREVTARVAEVGPGDAPVLLVAEEGAAAEDIARLVHGASGRAEGAFVVADASSVRPERSLAALFGERDQPGWLQLAAGGTLLLKHLPALSRVAQARLAAALASRQATLADDSVAYPVEARVVAMSRVALTDLRRRDAIDSDLRRRLTPSSVRVPPLRERREDLASLIYVAIDHACRARGLEVVGIEDEALRALSQHRWPGNLGELASVIDGAVAKVGGGNIRIEHLPTLAGSGSVADDVLDASHAEMEQRLLRHAMDRASGNKSEAARLLGLKRTTFLDKLKRHGLSEPPARAQPAE